MSILEEIGYPDLIKEAGELTESDDDFVDSFDCKNAITDDSIKTMDISKKTHSKVEKQTKSRKSYAKRMHDTRYGIRYDNRAWKTTSITRNYQDINRNVRRYTEYELRKRALESIHHQG